MKKLLGIVVLGLLLNTSVFAEWLSWKKIPVPPDFLNLGYENNETEKSILKSRFLAEVVMYENRRINTKKYYNAFNLYPNEITILAYDALGLIYYVWKKNNGINIIKVTKILTVKSPNARETHGAPVA